MKKILFMFFLYLTMTMQVCHAYQMLFSNELSLNHVKEKILDDINVLEQDNRINKNDALLQRYRIVSRYEKAFEEHMSELRQLDDDIYMRKNIVENIKEIKRWQETIKKENEALSNHVESYTKKYRDIYFPVIYASFVEMSAIDEKDYETYKDSLMFHSLLPSLIDAYGLNLLSFNNIVTDHSAKESWVKLSQCGAVAYDGLRSCDTCSLSNRDQSKTQKISVSLYRFKPLAPKPTKTKTRNFYSRLPFKVTYWDLNKLDQRNKFYALVKTHFSAQAPSILADIENYMNYLGDIQKIITDAHGQRDQFIRQIARLHKEYQSKVNLYNGRIQSLKEQNDTIKMMLALEGDCSIQSLQHDIEKKEWKKKQQESRFNHHFVMMKSSSADKYQTAITSSIHTIFDQLESMVKKVSVNIETVVSMGQFDTQEFGIIKYQPVYNNLSIDIFVDGIKTGVLFDLSVTYQQSEAADLTKTKTDTYVEKENGLNIKMTRVEIPDSDRFFFISQEITKAQFMQYIREEKETPATYLKDYDIENYPDNYPMFSVSQADINGFVQWLQTKTQMKYRLPVQEEWDYAQNKNISSDTGFRVVYYPR